MNPKEVRDLVFSEPFRAFRLCVADGRTFDVRHPEFVQIGRDVLGVYQSPACNPDGPERWEDIALDQIETIVALEPYDPWAKEQSQSIGSLADGSVRLKMAERRKEAYAFLLSAGLLHLKWELADFRKGLNFWRPWRLLRQSRQIRRAAHRAIAFHNLASFMTWGLAGFSEVRFWKEIEAFRQRFPDDQADYQEMFERKLSGEEISIARPNQSA
jgi:hypothetical protein